MSIGWGFIGASTIAKEWMIDAVRAQRGHDVVAVMSSNLQRGQAYAEENNIAKAYDNLSELLADPAVNCVYVSTTNELHKPQVLAAAAAGKHVLCEKPLALQLEDAAEMVAACKAAGVLMGTNHHLRNAATHRAIRAEVVAGTLGEIVAMRIFHAVALPANLQTWRINQPNAGGGAVLDVAVHDADTVRYLLGEDPLDVMAYQQYAGIENESIKGADNDSRDRASDNGVEDGSMTIMRMPSGAMVQTHESFVVPFAGTGVEIHGRKGSIIAKDIMTPQPIGSVEVVTAEGRRRLDIEPHNLYEFSLKQFAKAIADKKDNVAEEHRGQPSVTGEDGAKSLAIALAITESAHEGKRVSVKYPHYD